MLRFECRKVPLAHFFVLTHTSVAEREWVPETRAHNGPENFKSLGQKNL